MEKIQIEDKYWNNLNWGLDTIGFSNDPLINDNCLVILIWHLIRINTA